jgi:putrescine transport system ATP-binding protein
VDARPDRPLIRFDGVSKRFGTRAAVSGVDLEIGTGEFFALLGPSGSGKTTLMRLLAGFEAPDQGRVLLEGADLAGLPPHRRPVNMMFQSYALFPHMSVAENIGYGLKMDGLPKREIAGRVEEMLALVRLDGFGARRPHQLSGGERQRVALARALARRPRVLLLDEPLAALDRRLREDTQFELKAIQARLGATFLVVTHDQDEAMRLADRMAVLREGRVVQVGRPRDLYEQPADRYVAGFLGEVNLLAGRVKAVEAEAIVLALDARAEVRAPRPEGVSEGDAAWLSVRPERLRLLATPAPGALAGEIADTGYLGDRTTWRVRLDDGQVLKVAAANSGAPGPTPERGARAFVAFDPAAAWVLVR